MIAIKPYTLQRWKQTILILLAAYSFQLTSAAQITPLIPPPLPQNEEALLLDALNTEPEILEGGYRQHDLIVARLNTWNDGPRNITVRLLLPPGDGVSSFPLVAYVHGGGFIGGSSKIKVLEKKKRFGYAMRALLDEGFAVASMDYRLAREAGWPAPISDVLCGLRFLSKHASHWKVDARSIGIAGHSAGARIAALTATADQNEFHRQGLPWGNSPVNFAAIWLWAGSAWDWPTASQWTAFGKPRHYSVPRLLFGEHPAWDDAARHRIRIRSHLPHLSMDMPPLYALRGASDYAGDHTDAERAVEIWKALGSDAQLEIVPGGHNAIGGLQSLTEFFKTHLRQKLRKENRERNLTSAARLLNDIQEPLAAVEVLVQKYTKNGGHTLPHGHWIILHDGDLMWNPNDEGWAQDDQEQLQRARKTLARQETVAAEYALKRGEWFHALYSAENTRSLDPAANRGSSIAEKAKEEMAREKQIFSLLHEANNALRNESTDRAKKILQTIEDPRLESAFKRISEGQQTDMPTWASDGGIDVYGRWATLSLNDTIDIRFRWVEPGNWYLLEHLYFRNKQTAPLTKNLTITNGFWLAETETTIEQWLAVEQNSTFDFSNSEKEHPVSMVNYLQIIDWLEQLEQRHPGLIARLPFEEEWLFAAAVSGQQHAQPPIETGSVHALSIDPKNPGPLPVKTLIPNLGGYYGLGGSVMEWTASAGESRAYFKAPNGDKRVFAYPIARGGAWSSMPHSIGLSLRKQQRHGNRQGDLGFRIAIGGDPDADNWLKKIEQHND